MLELLAPVSDSAKEKITTDLWGLAPAEPTPFAIELLKAGV